MRKNFLAPALCLTLAAFVFVTGCGGGGGGDDDSGDQPLDQEACGVIGSTAKIINGTACVDSGPVVKLSIDGLEFNGTCSGTMVAPNKVLTAAHCVLEFDFASVVPQNGVTVSSGVASDVLARSVSIQAPFLRADIETISENFDQDLDPQSPEFIDEFEDEIFASGLRDVAVVELDRNLSLPTLPIVTGFLPDEGEILSIFGFGIITPDGIAAVNEVYSGEMRVDRNGRDNIFTIFDTAGSNTCKGDSGGPAIVVTSAGQAAVIGVTSLGFSDCQPGEVSVFANTSGRSADFLRTAASGATFLQLSAAN